MELVRSLDCSKPQLCALWKGGGAWAPAGIFPGGGKHLGGPPKNL